MPTKQKKTRLNAVYSGWQQQDAAGRKTFTFALNDQREKDKKRRVAAADRSDGLRVAMDPNWRLKRQQQQVPDDDDHEDHHRRRRRRRLS